VILALEQIFEPVGEEIRFDKGCLSGTKDSLSHLIVASERTRQHHQGKPSFVEYTDREGQVW
jgi:hypothetical protein